VYTHTTKAIDISELWTNHNMTTNKSETALLVAYYYGKNIPSLYICWSIQKALRRQLSPVL